MALRLDAPAKVNLILRIVGKRPDGYHELETLFHAVDLADELIAERTDAEGVSLQIVGGAGSGLPVVADDDNLVVRAARRYLSATGVDGGLRFWLRKRIPAGGGLGGGSSDAASALRLADALHGEVLGLDALEALAAPLGADVPFFIRAETQIGRGTGTDLQPVDPVSLQFVLLLPPFGTSTVRVYENYRPQLNDDGALPTIPSIERAARDIRANAMLINDLEPAAASAYPELARSMADIADAGYPDVRVSGSGSSMFLAFESHDEADAARARLAGCSAIASRSISVVRASSARASACAEVPWPEPETEH